MPVKRFVTPAKAGVQCLKQTFKRSFKDWIPAFAGMTNPKLLALPTQANF